MTQRPKAGLYNGTRVQITGIWANILFVKILTGNMRNADQEIIISRKKFEYGRKRSEPGIKFTRTQYPLEPGFALTISKAQGQTLGRVGIDIISRQCFSHGMLYTEPRIIPQCPTDHVRANRQSSEHSR